MGVRKWFIIFLIALLLGYLVNALELSVEASTFEQQAGLSFTPDKSAYTTDLGRTDWEWYPDGTQVQTGVKSELRQPNEGEHYYPKEVYGEVHIGEWKVAHMRGKCIHNQYPEEFHEVNFGRMRCWQSYFSGWLAYCADCEEVVVKALYYMSNETAKGLKMLDLSKSYYYNCPHCNNLEQAYEPASHICRDISWNRYYVSYDANQGNGYMPKSVHMYNNATGYEGKEVTPQTTLNLCTFTRRGYTFAGWNTKADGSGQTYGQGAEILNLSTEEGGVVTLYAQWKKCTSILQIDPAGGGYAGSKLPVCVEGSYGEVYTLASDNLVTPSGYTIHFETQGGEVVADIQGKTVLEGWQRGTPFWGKLEGQVYEYGEREGVTDYIKAIYREIPIVLPETKKEGATFGGWYLDEECTKPAGGAGHDFLPGKDMTLYAGWVDLQLTAKNNYGVNGGKGAVDLSWSQQDNNNKVYEVFQKVEGSIWVQLSSATQKEIGYEVSSTLDFCGRSTTYTIPFSGFYALTLYGAQGKDYGERKGGKGGMVQATVFLSKGEVLTCTVGGQNGFGGGGAASKYGCGGGCSQVSSNQKGMLLVAGGGGGASLAEDGQAGGLLVGLTNEEKGENGVSGGGGGYQGGCAGVAEIHSHTSECRHVHVGTPATYGGCYTIPVACGGKRFLEKEVSANFYYGNVYWNNGKWESCFCDRCGSYECPGHRDYKYEYICEQCKKTYTSRPGACTEQNTYAPGCERSEVYVCGMTEGEIIRTTPAYGGSNYVNSEYCFQYSKEAGIRTGNGGMTIVSQRIGMLDVHKLCGVEAADLKAPTDIDLESVEKTAVSEKEIRISFLKPEDAGTVYYHQVKSYNMATNQWLCTSNITVNTLISGMAGYYYVIDKNSSTQVGAEAIFLDRREERPFLVVEVIPEKQYLHIAPVDKAGNVGKTVHISISAEDVIYWPIRTEIINISTGTHVVADAQADTYYVKADGSSPVEVKFEGVLCGTAGAQYQIDEMSFCMSNVINGVAGDFTVMIPRRQSVTAGTFTYSMQSLQKRVSGENSLQDDGFTVAKRYNQCKSVEVSQRFVLPSGCDGQQIHLTPRAAAKYGKDITYSDAGEDSKNGIYLIADGSGPYIEGMEALNGLEYIDFAETEEIKACIRAQDFGSGLARFYVEVYNQENATTVRHEDTDLNGTIEFVISKEDLVYNGEFSVIVYSADKVGNESVMSTDLLGVGLVASVERILDPHDQAFKRGESGVLYIQTIGYVERVEVIFPQDFEEAGAEYSQLFVYDNPGYIQNEAIEFMVPLSVPDGAKQILVKAYKAGTELEKTPQLLTIEITGSVLDELRTRLR